MAVAGVSVTVVAATGWWLAQNYRPGAWVETAPDHFRIELGGGWIHDAHVWAAIVLQIAAVAFLVTVVLALVRRSSTATTGGAALASVGLAAAVAIGFVSGRDLRWSQLALWAVTVGDGFYGVWDNAFAKQGEVLHRAG